MQKESTCPFFYSSNQAHVLHLEGNWQAPLRDTFHQPCTTAQEKEYFVAHLSENSSCGPTTVWFDCACHDSLWNGQVNLQKMYHSARRIIRSLKAVVFGHGADPSLNTSSSSTPLSSEPGSGQWFHTKSPKRLRICWAVPSELWCPLRCCLFLAKFAFEQSLRQGLCCRQFVGSWFQERGQWGREETRRVWVEAVSRSGPAGGIQKPPTAVAGPPAALLLEHFSSGSLGPLMAGYPGLFTASYLGSRVEWDSVGMWKGASELEGLSWFTRNCPPQLSSH